MPLAVQRLSKRFGKLQALSEVSFSVRSGELLALIGPNGAGKSTLFECMAGVLPYESGSVVNEHGSPATFHDLFYVPDGITPYPEQPVSWVLDFTLGFFGGPHQLRAEVIDQLDLKALLRQSVGTLSKGQRKRALLAIGLLTPQPVLLIDEPLDGLDLRQMRDVAGALKTHAQRGRTLFLSIHQISDAARFCDRFVLLSGGSVRGEGTIQELASLARVPSENLEEVFLALT